MTKPRIFYILALAADIFVFISTNTRPPLIAAAVMIIIPFLSFLCLKLFMRSLNLSCSAAQYTEAGRKIELIIEINSILPIVHAAIFMRCTVKNRLFGDTEVSQIAAEISHGARRIVIPFESEICGRVEYKIDHIRCYDLFYLFHMDTGFRFIKEIAVYPAEIELHSVFSQLSSKEQDGLSYDPFKKGNDTGEILEMRDYHKGDSVKNIHWKLSARLNKAVVREFSRPNSHNTVILCDMTLAFAGSVIEKSAVSNNISIAMSLSRGLIMQGVVHSVCMMNEDVCKMSVISDLNDHARMVNEIISMKLSKKSYNTIEAFLNLGYTDDVSKLIYITREYDSGSLRLAAQSADITVILTNSEGRTATEDNGSIKIMSLDESSLYDTEHYITV
ncbi:MAG: DUF58 domain-containing protein [Clostridia bacterium]|nr:DUF58 domain-containing protein [Clostridia bacterium]